MAADITTQTVRRYTSSALARYTGLPKIPQDLPVPEAGQRYPAAAVMRRSSVVPSTSVVPTWIAQPMSGSVKAVYTSVESSLVRGFPCDPSTVDWPSVTRTDKRPLNPNGGRSSFVHTLGTARLMNGATPLGTATATEVRQPLLVGTRTALNTFTVARKLPPSCSAAIGAGGVPLAFSSYDSGVLGAIYDTLPVSPKAFRWLGGSITVGAFIPIISLTVNVYVVPVDPTTLDADFTAKVLLGSIAAVGSVLTTATYTAAQIAAATVVRWNWFFLMVARPGGVPGGSSATYTLFAPTDVPPPYDCPGVDGMLFGGFLT
jgi:hypothetical protein